MDIETALAELPQREKRRAVKRALTIILGISLFGVAFSGTLTYRELFGQTAAVCTGVAVGGLFAGRRSRWREHPIGASLNPPTTDVA
jgi:hypothetical protein